MPTRERAFSESSLCGGDKETESTYDERCVVNGRCSALFDSVFDKVILYRPTSKIYKRSSPGSAFGCWCLAANTEGHGRVCYEQSIC